MILLLMWLPHLSGSEKDLRLCSKSASIVPTIITSKTVDRKLAPAVDDLTRVLEKMTGLKPILSDKETGTTPFIAIGDNPVTRKYVSRDQFKGKDPESYLIRTVDGGLVLTGASPPGTCIAIYTWLHSLGCRWFFPGEIWEEVPKKDTVLIEQINEAGKPSFRQRKIWYGWGTAVKSNRVDQVNWNRRNRLDGILTGTPGHAYHGIARPDHDFKTHPEWFPEIKGKRVAKGQLCLSNKALQELAASKALDSLRKNPARYLISASPNDGGGYCECEACKAMGSRADQTLALANKMAERIATEFPDKLIGMYAYYANCMPPTIKGHANVIVYIATSYITGGFTLKELIEGWGKKVKNIGIRDYYDVIIWSRDSPRWTIEKYQKWYPFYFRNNVVAINGEASNNWGAQGLNYYIAGRLMWNAEDNVDSLLDDFYRRCWGRAELPMRRYYQLWKERYPANDLVIRLAYDQLNEAAALAKTDPVILARIDLMRMYLHWVYLYRQHRLAKTKEAMVATGRRALHFSWRLAGTNMVHTYGHFREKRMWRLPGVIEERLERWKCTDQPQKEYMHPAVGNVSMDKLDEPDLGIEMAEKVVLKPVEPVATFPHDVAEKIVQQDLKALPATFPFDQVVFSENLVPLPESKQPVSHAADQSPELPAGNRIHLETHPSGKTSISFYPKDLPCETVAEDIPHKCRLSFEASLKKHLSLPPPGADLFFYVNRGAKHVQIILDSAKNEKPELLLKRPDGSSVTGTVDQSHTRTTLKVGVPTGSWGIWSLQVKGLKKKASLTLIGVPPYVAKSPGNLLVPAETLNRRAQ